MVINETRSSAFSSELLMIRNINSRTIPLLISWTEIKTNASVEADVKSESFNVKPRRDKVWF